MDEDKLRKRIIPQNVFQGKRILGFKSRNFKEALIFTVITILIIMQIPFVTKVRWIMIICIGAAVFMANCVGIKNQAFTEFIGNMLRFQYYRKPFHYRRLNNGKAKNKPAVVNGKVQTIKENRTNNLAKFILSGRK